LYQLIEVSEDSIGSEFEPQSGQTKDYKIGICCFTAKACSIEE